MNQRILEGKWLQLKGTVVSKLGKLMSDPQMIQKGESEVVRGKIQCAASSSES